MRFICQVSPDVKFTTFPMTTALQRKLSCGGFLPPYRFLRRRGVTPPYRFGLFLSLSVSRFESDLTMFYTSGSVKSSGREIDVSAARILGSSSGNSTVATVHIMS